MLMFLFTHDLFCKQLSYEIQEIRDSLFALHRYLDGGFACLLVFPTLGNGKRLEIFFELFQYIASGGVLIHDFRMLMAELAPFHHRLILSGLWL